METAVRESGAAQDHAEAEAERQALEEDRVAAAESGELDGAADPEPEPAEGVEEPQVDAGGDVVLDTGDDQLSFAVGGKRPQDSTLAFTGGKVGVTGQFSKGEDVRAIVTGRVNDVGFHDTLDKNTKQATTCSRRQKAQIVSCVLATPQALMAAAVAAAREQGADDAGISRLLDSTLAAD